MVTDLSARNISRDGQLLVSLTNASSNILANPLQYPLYTILLLKAGQGSFKADFATFPLNGASIIFSTPFQTIQLKGHFENITMLQFHGDYYCIEYHKKEVACNGILFNNVYTNPTVPLTKDTLESFSHILEDLARELSVIKPFDSVVTTLIQLLLAKATSIRMKTPARHLKHDEKMESLRELIEQNFISLRKPAQYAKLLNLSPNTLTKRCRQYFSKTPSMLIRERIILEAMKRLHLSRQRVKEIAHALRFEDEHYFSRFFKKATAYHPRHSERKQVSPSWPVCQLKIRNSLSLEVI